MSYHTDAYAIARTIYQSATTEITDTMFDLFVGDVEAGLILQWPCTGSGGVTTLSGSDLSSFTMALGYQLASLFTNFPGTVRFASQSTKVKVGPVEEDYGSRPLGDFTMGIDALAQRAMLKISCVRQAVMNNRDYSLGTIVVTGHRRQIGEALTIQNEARGLGQREIIELVSPAGVLVRAVPDP